MPIDDLESIARLNQMGTARDLLARLQSDPDLVAKLKHAPNETLQQLGLDEDLQRELMAKLPGGGDSTAIPCMRTCLKTCRWTS